MRDAVHVVPAAEKIMPEYSQPLDRIGVGLIDANRTHRLPAELGARLRQMLDNTG